MKDKSRLQHVSIYLNTFYNGGIERVMVSLAKAMVARGMQVDIVVNFVAFSPMLNELPDSITLVNLEANRFADRLPRLVRYIRSRRPQCIVSATHVSNELACLAKAFSMTGVRIVATEHTNLSTELKKLPATSLRRAGIPLFGKLTYRFVDNVVGVSDGVRKDAEKLFSVHPNKCRTIYNPIDAQQVLSLSQGPFDHPPPDDSWFQPEKKPVILAIGRLEEQKDFPTLLTAFAKVRAHADARLAILGEGSQRQALTARIHELGLDEHVWLAGFIANPYPYFKRASVFALSSAWEGLSMALIEALILGVPVVSTDCPSGPSEVLNDGEYGRLVPVKDSEALADGILQMLHGNVLKVPAEAISRYTVDSVLDQYLEVMSSNPPLK